jgi:hypothetical protein
MSLRRFLLTLGLLLLLFSAAHRASAGTPVDVEAGGYGGSSSGAWACGPRASAKFGGIGGEVQVRPFESSPSTPPAPATSDGEAASDTSGEVTPRDEGFVASGAGAVEYREYDLVHCNDSDCGADGTPVPPSGLLFGANLKAGYDWRWIGFRAGALVWEEFDDNEDRKPLVRALPDVALRIGPRDVIRGELGLGSYALPTLLRPGAYAGIGYSPAPRWDLALHGGIHRTFDDSGTARFDLALKAPLGARVQIGAGAALSEGTLGRVEPDGRLFFVGAF